MRSRALFSLLLLFSLSTLPAFALPGEAAAVLEQCGAPTSQTQDVSPLNARDERNLVYGNLTMHFTPMEGGWSFTTAWRNHLPVARDQLVRQMPCFASAMQEATAAPQPAVDPTIAQEITQVKTANFGIPYFWLIVMLTIVLLLVGLWPRKPPMTEEVVIERPVRGPAIFTANSQNVGASPGRLP